MSTTDLKLFQGRTLEWWNHICVAISSVLDSTIQHKAPVRLDEILESLEKSLGSTIYRQGVQTVIVGFLTLMCEEGLMSCKHEFGISSPYYKVIKVDKAKEMSVSILTPDQGIDVICSLFGIEEVQIVDESVENDNDVIDALVTTSVSHKPKRIDAAAVYDLMVQMSQAVDKMAELQVQTAETLIFVKDEVVAMRDKQVTIAKRLRAIEETFTLDKAANDNIQDSIANLGIEFQFIRNEIQAGLGLGLNQSNDAASSLRSLQDKMDQIHHVIGVANRLQDISQTLKLIHNGLEGESDD